MILRSETSLSFFICSICIASCCFCISNSSLRNLSALSLASFPLQVSVFPLSLLVPSSLHVSAFPPQVSVFPLSLLVHASVFPLSLLVHASLHVFVSLHLVFVYLHPVSSSSSFASYFSLSSMD